jgi:hypothetical protein
MTTRHHLSVATLATCVSWASLAAATQTVEESQPAAARTATGVTEAPPPRRGFQLALRTGYSVPFGDIMQDVPMSDWFGGQVPFTVDIGGKIGDYVFLGGFIGISVGGVGDPLAEVCDCISVGAWLGPEVHVSFLPAGKVDPWLGYGLGLEYNSVGNDEATVDFSGFVPLLLTGGVNFRLSPVFGLGPFAGVSVASYSETGADDGDVAFTVEIDEPAPHGWFTLGVRGVFFP